MSKQHDQDSIISAEMNPLLRFVAAGFGSGLIPFAPGTWGSLFALIPAYWILYYGGGYALLGASLLLLAIGCALAALILPMLQKKDPAWIVIDEWAGQWLALAILFLFASNDISPPLLFAGAFVGFRLFDILKPWPISWLERQGPAWWSIMIDDMAAGLAGGLLALPILGLIAG